MDADDATGRSAAARGFVYAPYTSAESPVVPAFWAQRYEDEAAHYWDKFYARNADRFFKDRHYLATEWSELKADDGPDADDAEHDEVRSLCAGGSGSSELVLLEAGCGAGNTLLPLMRANPSLRVYGFDFSEKAVQLVMDDPLYRTGRIVAAVGDLTTGELPAPISGCEADLCTLMFVLSAISEAKMPAALRAVRAGVRDGGLVLFRDYAVGDGAQLRLQQSRGAKQLDETARFFVRQDGTRAYYFGAEQLCALWEAAGFDVLRCEYSARVTVNHKKGVALERRYVTAKFRKRPDGVDMPAPRPASVGEVSRLPTAAAAAAAAASGAVDASDASATATPQPPPVAAAASTAPALAGAPEGGVAAADDEAARAWLAAKQSLRGCVAAALDAGASQMQRCRLLEEVRSELLAEQERT